MKSAYELAMERIGLSEKKYTDKQKDQLAKIDKEYDQKVKETQFAAEDELRKAADDTEKIKQIKTRLANNLESLEIKREKEKDKIRGS
ncbi:MAG: hypothetical protein JXN60_02745 [Lentisphaerae bacterium]|nr:hypothetical protein [Lentisphaerota bacterium]